MDPVYLKLDFMIYKCQKSTEPAWDVHSPSCTYPYRRRVFSRAMKVGLTVQRMPCTSSQLAWTCRDASARLLLYVMQRLGRAEGDLYVKGPLTR